MLPARLWNTLEKKKLKKRTPSPGLEPGCTPSVPHGRVVTRGTREENERIGGRNGVGRGKGREKERMGERVMFFIAQQKENQK